MRIRKYLDSTPLFALYLTYDQVLSDFQKRLLGEEVHFIQALILTGLFFEEKAVRPSVLARTLRASRSNISHAIRGLERKGWVARETDPQDARAYWIKLTREGKKKAPRLIKMFDATDARIEKVLQPTRLVAELNRLVEAYRGSE